MDIEPNDRHEAIRHENEEPLPRLPTTEAMAPSNLLEETGHLSPFEKITHANPKVRADLFLKLAQELEATGQLADQELVQYLRTNGEMLMSESVVENQKLVLRISVRIEQLQNESLFMDISKKPFWYNFFDKYLSSTKAVIKDEAWKLFELLFERIDKQAFLNIAMEFLGKNNLKIMKLVLTIFNNKFEQFKGWCEVQGQAVALIDKLLLNPNPELRAAAQTLLKHLALMFSMDITKNMKNLKPAITEEIRTFLVSKGGSVTQAATRGNKQERGRSNKPLVDLYKVSEPVSIVGKFPSSWCDKVIATDKWSEKKSMMETFFKAADVPRLQTDDYFPIVNLAKILMKHSNMLVQICGIKTIGLLAKGLRAAFRPQIKANLETFISKFKDKKGPILEALHSAMCECFYCLSVEDIYEEVKIFNTQRNKDIRMNILRIAKNLFEFLVDQEATANTQKTFQTFIKNFGALLNIYYDDPDIEVRKYTNEVVLVIHDSWKDTNYWDQLLKVVEPKKIKVKERNERLDATPTKSEIYAEKALQRDVSPTGLNRSVLAKLAKSAEKKPKGPLVKANPKEVHFYSFKQTEILHEEASAYVLETFGDAFFRQPPLPAKEKAEAIKTMAVSVSEMDNMSLDQRFVTSVCGFLKKELKDFNEINPLLIKSTLELFEVLVQKVDNLEEVFGYFSMLLARKFSEPKFKSQLQSILAACKRKLPFHKMLHITLYSNDFLSNQKPKIEVLHICLEYFDNESSYIINDLNIILLAGFNNSNPAARTTAVALLKTVCPVVSASQIKEIVKGIENQTLSKQVSQEIQSLLVEEEVKPPTMINPFNVGLDEEEVEKKPKTIISIEEVNDNGMKKNTSDFAKKVNSSSMQDIVAGLIKPDWKTRKDSVDAYIRFIEHNTNLLSPMNVSETFERLSSKLKDSNRLVALSAVIGLKQLLDTHFAAFKAYHRTLISAFLEFLIDKNVL
jgi:hypothetical protein